ncbi:hypothetical protein F4781DRAFT_348433 [Annulohypoxylon bovei var. microspora]|nr:hypothetical protein F4781DRAFT_348433 [Annulohypoxylon bovei var. microspora]
MEVPRLDAASGAYMLGCALLKHGKLLQAELVFLEGGRLAQNDYRFPSGRATVRYEMGNYAGAVYFLGRALRLVDPQSDGVTMQELYLSLAKACLLSGHLKKAQTAISNITSEHDRRPLEQILLGIELATPVPDHSTDTAAGESDSQNQGSGSQPLYSNKKVLWNEVFERLARYRPTLRDERRFIAVSSDNIHPLFRGPLTESGQRDYSFLFANTGDARNVFVTLAQIGELASKRLSLATKMFYFTLVDLEPAALARNLLFFRMMADSTAESGTKQRVTLATLTYTFAAQVMPSWAYDRQQVAIKHVLNDLHGDVPLIMGRFSIDSATRGFISSHLQNWQKSPQDWYSAEGILGLTRQQHAEKKMIIEARGGDVPIDRPPPGCEPGSRDTLAFQDLSFMLPSTLLMKENEPGMLELLGERSLVASLPPIHKVLLDIYVKQCWRPNMTLLDFDLYSSKQSDYAPALDFTPQEVVCQLFCGSRPENLLPGCCGVFEHLTGFFKLVAEQFEMTRHQTMFKMVANDAANVMESAGLHLLNQDNTKFPDRYDTIYMGHLSGSIGGPLATFIHGIPILRHDNTSELESTVAFNRTQWVTYDQFLSEHLSLDDRSTITNTFAAGLTEQTAWVESYLSHKVFSHDWISSYCPLSWSRTSSKPLRWDQLMPQHELVKWLRMYFLKLCIPPCRANARRNDAYTSLNMTIFFRLTIHLSRIGYPSHWLSSVLMDICTGKISSQNGAPEMMVADKLKTAHKSPQSRFCIEPFIEEFRSQLGIWKLLLPFNILQSDSRLPRIDTIREYKQRFPHPDLPTLNYNPNVALILWDVHRNGEIPRDNLRQALLDDKNTDPKYQGISSQTGRAHVISTIKLASPAMTASFWFADGPIQDILSTSDHWEAWLWDIRDWTLKLGPARVNQMTLTVGDSWCSASKH